MTIKNERLLSKAKKLVKKGELEEAKSIYLTILKEFPNNAQSKAGLKDLEKKINNPNLQNLSKSQINSVISDINSGEIKVAIKSINNLIASYPRAPILYNLMGICHNAISQFDKAVIMFAKAVKIKADYAEAYYNLGSSQKKIGRLQEAIESYKRAIGINPKYLDAYNNLGNIYRDLGNLNEAKDSYEWAIAYNPEYAIAHINLALLYSTFELEKALHHFNKAISINPNYPEAHFSLGTILSSLGQKNDSIKSYEKAIELRPDYADAHNALSTIKKYKKNDSQAIKMKSLIENNNLSLSEKISLNFALANVNEDLKNSKDFFYYLNEANRLNKKKSNYSFEKDKEILSKIRDIFEKTNSKVAKSSLKNETLSPIFIIGMPRSGTSLVEQILSSHKEVFGAGELDFLSKSIFSEIQNEINDNEDFESISKKSILSLDSSDFHKIISKNFINKIRNRYYSSIGSFDISENIFTDKMPLNFRFVGFIISAFPDAKIVHLKRDSIATCWSIYKHYFKSNGNGYSSSMDDLALYFNIYRDLMDFWHKKFPNKIYDISYEGLTLNQEEETRKLLNFCGLDWDENCLNFYKNSRAVQTASGLQVREKMYQGSSDAWKKYKKYLEPLISKLD